MYVKVEVLFMDMLSYNDFLLFSLLSFLFFFFSSPFLGDSYIWYRPSLIIWALHLLIIQTPTWAPVPSDTLTSSLWVAVTKVTLFRGLLLINAAKRVVVVHLMWWWQPLLGYFEPSFFLCVWSEGYSNWDASLIWTLGCPRRNYSSDVFSLPSWLGQGFTGRASLRTGSSSDGPKAQPTCYSGPVPTIAPQNSGFDLPPRRKAGFWHLWRMERMTSWSARVGSYFWRATSYEVRPFTPDSFMSPSSNGEMWIWRPALLLEFVSGRGFFSLPPAI